MRVHQYLKPALLLGLCCLAARPLAAQGAEVKALMTKDLAADPAKEALMLAVEYPPGAVEQSHRHHAQAFVYMLEGSVVMQLKGGPEVTLNPGDTFYEGVDDIHLIGRNASKTAPARFVVVLVKDKGAAAVLPVK